MLINSKDMVNGQTGKLVGNLTADYYDGISVIKDGDILRRVKNRGVYYQNEYMVEVDESKQEKKSMSISYVIQVVDGNCKENIGKYVDTRDCLTKDKDKAKRYDVLEALDKCADWIKKDVNSKTIYIPIMVEDPPGPCVIQKVQGYDMGVYLEEELGTHTKWCILLCQAKRFDYQESLQIAYKYNMDNIGTGMVCLPIDTTKE